MALLSYRPNLDAITDKNNLLSNDHIEIKNSLLEACRKYGSKVLNNDFLSLENKNITLNITIFKSEVVTLEILPYLTIGKLKQRLFDIIGIAEKNQRLLHNGFLLVDSNKINSYGLNKNSKIELLPYFRVSSINIKITNEEITNLNIDANPDCLVKYLKKIVQYKLNINVKNQLFIFDGQDLDDNKRLSDYKLFNNAFIYLGIRSH